MGCKVTHKGTLIISQDKLSNLTPTLRTF